MRTGCLTKNSKLLQNHFLGFRSAMFLFHKAGKSPDKKDTQQLMTVT